jgi:hypothetical protein
MNPAFRTQLAREGVVFQSAIKIEREEILQGNKEIWDVKELSTGLAGTEY